MKVKDVVFLYKKYLDFEKKYGDKETLLAVHEKAIQFSEKMNNQTKLNN